MLETSGAVAQEKPIVLPRGFEAIVIGIPLQDFVEKRPKAKPFGFMDTPKQIDLKDSQQNLIEDIRHPFFQVVFYNFEKGKLQSLVFAGQASSALSQSKRHAFLSQLIAIYGHPTAIKVVERNGPEAGLFWVKNGYSVQAFSRLPDKKQGVDGGVVELLIAPTSDKNLSFPVAKITSTQAARLLKPLRASVRWLLKSRS